MNIGEQIKHFRTKKGMSQEELALAIGMSGKKAIYRFEKGIRIPKLSVLHKIADVLGCELVHELRPVEDPGTKEFTTN